MGQLEKEVKLDIPKEYLWENLKISNDFIFAKVMRNPVLCKGILERLLDISINRIEYPEEQKVIDISKDSKSVRLDVYLQDSSGTVYNIEIQTTNNRNLPRRSRFYQGMIDLNSIEKGENYIKLPESFVIFICTFDLFGKGRWKYTFRNVCKEERNILLDDGTSKIFFNTSGTKGKISREAVNVLKFIEDNTAGDDFTRKLEHEVQKIKENKEWKVEYMTLLMREQEKYMEGKAAGMAAGMTAGTVQTCKNLNLSFQETIQYLFDNLGLSLQQAEETVNKYWNGLV